MGGIRKSKAKATLPCSECGLSVQRFPADIPKTGRIFCNQSCYWKWKKGRDLSRNGREVILTCAYCGKEFVAEPSEVVRGRTFCSLKCKGLHKTMNRTVERICENCGIGFRVGVRQAENGVGRYCTRSCYEEMRQKSSPKEAGYRIGHKTWRDKVFARDGRVCRECGATDKIEAHHINPWKDFPELRFDPNNGIALCIRCHRRRHTKH